MSEYSFIAVFWKIFFLVTPFFVLSVFIATTENSTPEIRKRLAVKVTLAVAAIAVIVYFFGEWIFGLMGITLAAFQVGAGIILLRSSIQLISGSTKGNDLDPDGDISVVPLALPYTIGPGTIGTLMVMSASTRDFTMTQQAAILGGLLTAVAALGAMLYFSNVLERVLRRKGIQILSKITALVLASLASQLILTGAAVFFK